MHGKARMLSLSPYFSARAFIAVKSLTVVPHRDATFSTRVGLPRKDLKSTAEPSILLAEKSASVDIFTAARAAPTPDGMPTVKPRTAETMVSIVSVPALVWEVWSSQPEEAEVRREALSRKGWT